LQKTTVLFETVKKPSGAAAPNSFPRGEAVAKIGSSEPILVTDEECGQKSNWRYIRQTYSQAETESLVEVFGFPVTVAYPPHSSSVTAYAVPPSPREKVLGRKLLITEIDGIGTRKALT